MFVLCMNVLSKLIDEAAEQRRTGYHPRCKNINLTHLCFADDLMIFADGTKRSLEGVLKVFEVFEKASGLKINLEKSTLFIAGIGGQHQEDILWLFRLIKGNYLSDTWACLFSLKECQ